MTIEDKIISISVEEYGVENNQYPRMSIFFNDILIEENIEVREGGTGAGDPYNYMGEYGTSKANQPEAPDNNDTAGRDLDGIASFYKAGENNNHRGSGFRDQGWNSSDHYRSGSPQHHKSIRQRAVSNEGTLLPEWTEIKAGNDVPKNERGAVHSCYKFIVELDNHDEYAAVGNYDETSTHKIRVVFSDTELSCCINIRSISIDSVIIIGRTSVPGAVNTENPELEISFTMPLYPYRKVSRLEKFNDEEVNYPEVFRIPFSSRIIKKHECKETLIEMMDDYYEKQEMTKFQSDKKLLSIPELYPLWLTFQTAFDDHCDKFNLPRVLISSSWFVLYKKLDSIKMHYHPGAVFVGAWYPYVDEESSGTSPMVIEHPSNQEIASSHSYRKGLERIGTDNMKDGYEIEEFEIQPRSGMMNIWPAYLQHWIRKNHTDHRYLVTVNTILYSERNPVDKDYRIEPLETW